MNTPPSKVRPHAICSQLLRYRDERGDDWADIIDMLTMHPEARWKVVRLGSERSRLPTNVRRAGRAGERRGTRLLFAPPRDAGPAPLPGYERLVLRNAAASVLSAT